MPVTVRECLELPVFAGARVVGGASGLERPVGAVTVLETIVYEDLLADLQRGNEMIITALVSAADDVEKQCRTLRVLNRGNESALVLFYVGIVVKELHPDLISTADEIGFPLVVMPPFKENLSYAETITAVMDLIISHKATESSVVKETILEISRLNFKNFPSVMQMLSEKFDCCLVITDMYYDPILIAPPPHHEKGCDYITVRTVIQKMLAHNFAPYKAYKADFNGSAIKIFNNPFSNNNEKLNLLAFDFTDTLTYWSLSNITSIAGICAGIWKYNHKKQLQTDIVQAILSDNPIQAKILLAKLNISLSSIQGIACIFQKEAAQGKEFLHAAAEKLKILLKDADIGFLFSEADDMLIFIPYYSASVPSVHERFINSIKALSDSFLNHKVNVFYALNTRGILEIGKIYKDFSRVLPLLPIIYPSKRVLSKYQIGLAALCEEITSKMQESASRYLELLSPISAAGSEELPDTLAVFLLDANQNTLEASKILYLHTNTIQYRLRKIRELLNIDLLDTSEILDLTVALAVRRIINSNS